MLGTIQEFVSRAAHQTGFERERYVEANLPTITSKIIVILLLGDFRAQAVFSSLLLHAYLKKSVEKKYVILCSWPGQAGLFPYVDEYWSITDTHSLRDLSQKVLGFENTDEKFGIYARSLRRYFEAVLTPEDFEHLYDLGFTENYFKAFGDLVCFYPSVPTANLELQKKLNERPSPKVFIYPARTGQAWYEKQILFKFNQDFWAELCQLLVSNHIVPVVYQNYSTFEVDSFFGDKCIYTTDRNWLNILSIMRSCNCVLDILSGVSRFAFLARSPSLVCDDRQRYFSTKDYELLDLIGREIPCRYIFSWPTMIESGNYKEVLEQIVNVLMPYLAKIRNYELPSPAEYYVPVSYDLVKEKKSKRLGMKFVKVERLVIDE